MRNNPPGEEHQSVTGRGHWCGSSCQRRKLHITAPGCGRHLSAYSARPRAAVLPGEILLSALVRGRQTAKALCEPIRTWASRARLLRRHAQSRRIARNPAHGACRMLVRALSDAARPRIRSFDALVEPPCCRRETCCAAPGPPRQGSVRARKFRRAATTPSGSRSGSKFAPSTATARAPGCSARARSRKGHSTSSRAAISSTGHATCA